MNSKMVLNMKKTNIGILGQNNQMNDDVVFLTMVSAQLIPEKLLFKHFENIDFRCDDFDYE